MDNVCVTYTSGNAIFPQSQIFHFTFATFTDFVHYLLPQPSYFRENGENHEFLTTTQTIYQKKPAVLQLVSNSISGNNSSFEADHTCQTLKYYESFSIPKYILCYVN